MPSTDLEDMVCEYEAIQRWEAGQDPSFSTGVCESLTCGYGRLDDYGYFQFPLYPAEKYSMLTRERRKRGKTT